jgi:tRNA G18 (ribose-2'-O)-methylase SpoU
MNTETPKKTYHDILEEIMISFQDDYELQNKQDHWVKIYKERRERLTQLQEEEFEVLINTIDDAHNLGFVEGMRYALCVMDMTDAGKNKALLERLLNILEK